MGRRDRRTLTHFISAAAVLAVLFTAFFAIDDILPIPDHFREILGFASADTTTPPDGTDLTSQEPSATPGQLGSLETSPTQVAQSAETSPTPDLSSEEESETLPLGESAPQPIQGASSSSATPPPLSAPVAPSATAPSPSSAADTTPPSFPTGAILVFRYPAPTGFTVGYTRATDSGTGVDHYRLYLDRITSLGGGPILSRTQTTTTGDEYIFAGLVPGPYRVTVTAIDHSGNESAPLVGEVLVGHAAPQVLVDFLDPAVRDVVVRGGWVTERGAIQLAVRVHTDAPTYKIRSTNLAGDTAVTASIESSATTTTVSISGEGDGQISVSAVDCYGLESTPTVIAMKIDRTPPTRVTLLRTRQPVGTDDLRLSWVRSFDLTSGISHYMIEVANEEGDVVEFIRRSSLANPYYRFTGLEPGRYVIAVTPVDVAGNEGEAVTISPMVGRASSGSSAGSSGSASEGGSSDDGDTDDEAKPTPDAPAVPVTEPADSETPSLPIDTKVNDSNRLYWLIGAVGFGVGLLLIYFTAVARAFSKKDGPQ